MLVGFGAVVLLALLGATFLYLSWPRANLEPSSQGLVDLKSSGASGRVVSAIASYHGHQVTLADHGGSFVPLSPVPTATRVGVTVELRRPSWIGWLAGHTAKLTRQVTTPYARLLTSVTTVPPGQAVYARFSKPVSEVSVTIASIDPIERLKTPSSRVEIVNQVKNGQAGIASVAAAPYLWESLPARQVRLTYFGTIGHTPMAIITPSTAGSALPASSPVKITLSEPVASVFGKRTPSITPVINGAIVPKGTWSEPTAYSLKFTPDGPVFWPGEQVNMHLPAAVRLSNGAGTVSDPTSTVELQGAPGSTLRLQQILAHLGYLPFNWIPSAPSTGSTGTVTASGNTSAGTISAQASMMVSPPQGTFTWRWNFPSALTSLWQPGAYTVMTKGAVMAFEQVEGLNTVGRANPLLWPTLIHALLSGAHDPHPYAWIQVSMQLPERLWLWSNGQVVLTNLVNTGIPQTPTAPGTYPIYLRFPFHYMSGYNPNGTYYHDPVYWINYFNGSDAVHGFIRASYGFPQSLGCVELPVSVAAQVYPQVHIGTLVTVIP